MWRRGGLVKLGLPNHSRSGKFSADFFRPKNKLSQFDHKIIAKSLLKEFGGKPMVPCDRFMKIFV